MLEMFNCAQTSESQGNTKSDSSQNRNPGFPRAKGRSEIQHGRRDEGNFHETKGAIKEQIGKVTNSGNLKAEEKRRENVGQASTSGW
jgi:uncharacterized protein YjbJ (UPF0337 family)